MTESDSEHTIGCVEAMIEEAIGSTSYMATTMGMALAAVTYGAIHNDKLQILRREVHDTIDHIFDLWGVPK